MKAVALGLLASLFLGGAFGNAKAEVESLAGDSMVLNLEVQVAVSAQAVVAHLAFDEDPAVVLPMLDRGGGLFGITTELPLKNYAVVFEAVGSDEDLSLPVLISDLGADFGGIDVPTPVTEPPEPEGLSEESRRFGWLALALAAASLAVLAVWVIIGKDEGDDVDEEE